MTKCLSLLLGVCWLAAPPAAIVTMADEYTVGPEDVLTIAVWRHPDLTGTFTVGADGAVAFPLLGPVAVSGKTLREVEKAFADRLAAGYVLQPQVTVTVQAYRSQRVFVTGEVRQPGMIVLTGPLTLLEALARAGSPTEFASNEAVIARPPAAAATGREGAPGAPEMIRVDIHELQKGQLAGNMALRDGDTVLVPRASTVHVMGEVRRPGDYAIFPTTTLAEVLSRAGGATERGSIGRVRVVRLVEGRKKQSRADLEDTLQPGDIVLVREKLF